MNTSSSSAKRFSIKTRAHRFWKRAILARGIYFGKEATALIKVAVNKNPSYPRFLGFIVLRKDHYYYEEHIIPTRNRKDAKAAAKNLLVNLPSNTFIGMTLKGADDKYLARLYFIKRSSFDALPLARFTFLLPESEFVFNQMDRSELDATIFKSDAHAVLTFREGPLFRQIFGSPLAIPKLREDLTIHPILSGSKIIEKDISRIILFEIFNYPLPMLIDFLKTKPLIIDWSEAFRALKLPVIVGAMYLLMSTLVLWIKGGMLETDLERQRPLVEEILKDQRELADLISRLEDQNSLLVERRTSWAYLQIFRALRSVDAEIVAIKKDGSTITVYGESISATAALEAVRDAAVENVPSTERVDFSQPITSRNGRESFAISAQLNNNYESEK